MSFAVYDNICTSLLSNYSDEIVLWHITYMSAWNAVTYI